MSEHWAERFHEAYERLAPEHGYRTREASAVPWADVPEQNKALMTAVAAEVVGPLEEALRALVIEAQHVNTVESPAQFLCFSCLQPSTNEGRKPDSSHALAHLDWCRVGKAAALLPGPASAAEEETTRAVARELEIVLFDLLVKTHIPPGEYDEYQQRLVKLYDLATDGCEHRWQPAQVAEYDIIPEQCGHCARTRWRIPK